MEDREYGDSIEMFVSDRRQAYIRHRIRRGAAEHIAGRIFVGFCVIALYIGIVDNHV